MAGIINIAYSLLILLIAAAGTVYVLWAADREGGEGGERAELLGGLVAVVVVAYLLVMIGGLVA